MQLMLITVLTFDLDNDIVGEPDIECLDEQIRVHVKTRKNFAGMHLFDQSLWLASQVYYHRLANFFFYCKQTNSEAYKLQRFVIRHTELLL